MEARLPSTSLDIRTPCGGAMKTLVSISITRSLSISNVMILQFMIHIPTLA